MTGTSRIGPRAGPRKAPAFISEFALPRSRVGNHRAKKALAAGKTGASPAPKANLTKAIMNRPFARPVSPVQIDQARKATVITRRAPTRWMRIPPGIWKMK
jgi:hypothetical protein